MPVCVEEQTESSNVKDEEGLSKNREQYTNWEND